jgi:hypothetical protein
MRMMHKQLNIKTIYTLSFLLNHLLRYRRCCVFSREIYTTSYRNSHFVSFLMLSLETRHLYSIVVKISFIVTGTTNTVVSHCLFFLLSISLPLDDPSHRHAIAITTSCVVSCYCICCYFHS